MSGAEIAAEVAAALGEAGSEVGTGAPLICTFRRAGAAETKPSDAETFGEADPTLFELTAVQTEKAIRDQAGMMTGMTKAVLMVDATGQEPLRTDRVAVGVRQADVDGNTRFVDIADVKVTAPGGVPVLYEVELAD